MLLSAHGRSFACAKVFFSSYRQSSILAMCILDWQCTSTRHDAAAVAHKAVCIRCCLLQRAAKSYALKVLHLHSQQPTRSALDIKREHDSCVTARQCICLVRIWLAHVPSHHTKAGAYLQTFIGTPRQGASQAFPKPIQAIANAMIPSAMSAASGIQ